LLGLVDIDAHSLVRGGWWTCIDLHNGLGKGLGIRRCQGQNRICLLGI
jgi:hypothetical protein